MIPLVEEFRSKIVLKNPSVLLVSVVKQSNLKMLCYYKRYSCIILYAILRIKRRKTKQPSE